MRLWPRREAHQPGGPPDPPPAADVGRDASARAECDASPEVLRDAFAGSTRDTSATVAADVSGAATLDVSRGSGADASTAAPVDASVAPPVGLSAAEHEMRDTEPLAELELAEPCTAFTSKFRPCKLDAQPGTTRCVFHPKPAGSCERELWCDATATRTYVRTDHQFQPDDPRADVPFEIVRTCDEHPMGDGQDGRPAYGWKQVDL